MTFELLLQDNYKQGRAEGLAEAEAQYKAKEAKYKAKAKEKEAQSVKNFYSKNIPLETISECTGLSLEDVKKIIFCQG